MKQKLWRVSLIDLNSESVWRTGGVTKVVRLRKRRSSRFLVDGVDKKVKKAKEKLTMMEFTR